MLAGDPPPSDAPLPPENGESPSPDTPFPTGDDGSSDALARAISSMLGSVIRDFDLKALNASKSQDQLSSSIDRLTRQLDQLLDDAPLLFIMQHAAMIVSVRKRVSSLNALLKSIQRRIDNIDRVLSVGTSLGEETKMQQHK